MAEDSGRRRRRYDAGGAEMAPLRAEPCPSKTERRLASLSPHVIYIILELKPREVLEHVRHSCTAAQRSASAWGSGVWVGVLANTMRTGGARDLTGNIIEREGSTGRLVFICMKGLEMERSKAA